MKDKLSAKDDSSSLESSGKAAMDRIIETVFLATTPSSMRKGDETADADDDNPIRKDDYQDFEDAATDSYVEHDKNDRVEGGGGEEEDDDDDCYQRLIDEELDQQFHEMLDEQFDQVHAQILQKLDDQIQKDLNEQLYSSIYQERRTGRRPEHNLHLEYQYNDDSDESPDFLYVGSSDEPHGLPDTFGAAVSAPKPTKRIASAAPKLTERKASVASINAAIQKLIDQHYRPQD